MPLYLEGLLRDIPSLCLFKGDSQDEKFLLRFRDSVSIKQLGLVED